MAGIAHVITPDSASGAQTIDGSLKFDGPKSNRLTRTYESAGNRTSWTWSCWTKRDLLTLSNRQVIFGGFSASNNTDWLEIGWDNGADHVYWTSNGVTSDGTAQRRDPASWYHFFSTYDGSNLRIYVNNRLDLDYSVTGNMGINVAGAHYIGQSPKNAEDRHLDGRLTQCYFIDGQVLNPSDFAFTDPLTNTWKPKKYVTTNTPTTVSWTGLPSGYSALDATQYSGTLSNILTDDSNYITAAVTNIDFDMGETVTAAGKLIIARFTSYADDSYSADYRIQTSNNSDFSSILENSVTLESENTSDFKKIFFEPTQNFRYIRFNYTGGSRVARLYLLNITGKSQAFQDFGTNGFYLPMDGNSPIGQDKSGRGNDYTPVNFGGSVALDSPAITGGRPILNTTQGGTQAGVGVFGSKQNVGYAVTVGPKTGGGNAYYIDGVERPTLTGLIRGATYTFDTSDSTVSSTHPFRLSATSAHGTEYTNGVAAITGAATTITIPHDAPESLYYYCTAHSGMGSSITGITTNEKLADQYASHCTLALPLVGSNGDVSVSVACTSTTKTITASNTTHSSVQSNFYSGSIYFDDTADEYISFPGAVFSGEFCVEFWYYANALATNNGTVSVPLSGDTLDQFQVGHTSSNGIEFYFDGSLRAQSGAISLDKWYHIAITRDSSNVLKLYVDGIQKGNTPTVSTSETVTTFYLGVQYRSSDADYHRTNGYVQDFRIYNGTVKYSSDFVVPSRSPDILQDTPSGVVGNSKLAKITDGAVSFDGTGDYLEIADNADFEMGAGDFTIEAFFYNQENAVQSMITKYGNSASDRSFWLGTLSSTNPSFYWYSGGSSYNINGGTGTLPLNKWSHVVAQRTSGDIYLFVDGKVVASATGASGAYSFNDTSEPVVIGSDSYASNEQPFQGFISNVRIVKGTGVYNTIGFTPPTAPLTNVTNTKLLCCQSNTSATEAAVTPGSITASGDAAATNFNPFITDINTVRGQETGYCTWNVLTKSEDHTLSNGNLDSSFDGSTPTKTTVGTLGMTSGKFYWESTLTAQTGSHAGIGGLSALTNGMNRAGHGETWMYTATNGNLYHQNSNSSYGATYAPGDVIGSAFDADNGTLEFYKNGISQGTAVTGLTTGPYYPAIGDISISNTFTAKTNFGQNPFKFAPPEGFQPLNTANTRPVNVISRPDQYVGITTWSGDSAASRNINIGMKPDFVWLKNRFVAGRSHYLYDSVRGFGANKEIVSNTTDEEGSSNHLTQNHGYVGGNTINGFTLIEGATNSNYTNQSGQSYVGWTWKAGGNKDTFNVDNVGYSTYTTAPGLNEGTIKIMGASVGTKQGFSIIKYRGNSTANATLPHGLSEAPKFVMIKNLSNTYGWPVLHTDVGTTGTTLDGSPEYYMMQLDTAGTRQNFSQDTIWNPTSTTVKIDQSGGANWVNNSNSDYIMYAWHSVPGFSKFGKWTNNNSNNGSFIELGFKPAVILLTDYDGGENWYLVDRERHKFNIAAPSNNGANAIRTLQPNQNNDEATADNAHPNTTIDFLSNGFKIRTTNAGSGEISYGTRNYIYAAWAEAPTIDLFGGGANAH